jgi:hypothetical protein
MRELEIEVHLVNEVEKAGGEIRKVSWLGRRHAPDRYCMFPDGLTAWVELKAPDKKPTAGQLREHARMNKMGQFVWVIDTKEKADRLVRSMLPTQVKGKYSVKAKAAGK